VANFVPITFKRGALLALGLVVLAALTVLIGTHDTVGSPGLNHVAAAVLQLPLQASVPVRDVTNPALQPVFGSCDAINQVPTGGFVSCNISFTSPTSSFSSVPAGHRLVTEFVSGEADVPTGTKPLEFGVKIALGNAYTDINFVPSMFIATKRKWDKFGRVQCQMFLFTPTLIPVG
jgi:hypothetical protein